MRVFVLDKRKKPLDPTTPQRARELLAQGRARVHKTTPFTIRLTDRLLEDSTTHEHVIGIDPGSRTTGIAIARQTETAEPTTGEVTTSREAVALVELEHRGGQIQKKLAQRAGYRRRRRSSNVRYRAPRFDNRTRSKGWLPPSLQHRVDTTLSQVRRLAKLVPVTSIDYEAVRFDTQKLQNPEIDGVEYQQGELFGFEVREYLLTKYDHQCVYCGTREGVLNIDHVIPKAAGGSNRVSNLVIACKSCNQIKGKQRVEDFVIDPKRLARIQSGLKRPLRDAAIVTATRLALHRGLASIGLPVTATSGGRTKHTRTRLGVPKEHCLDALCVGYVDVITGWPITRLEVKATGRGSHQRTNVTKDGFPRGFRTPRKRHHGFATGDLVRAIVPTGMKAGTHVGRVAVRATGNFNITTKAGIVQGINHTHCHLLQRGDGYRYQAGPVPGFLLPLKDRASAGRIR